ncbi:MAG: hypothetical protein ACRC1T_05670 [Clostridium chrysemydis]|uniref:hypothetical protein n=1 Tax=Clostridium chrysemydis TaxID=2665504 RepID=UPI003F3B99EC
MELMELKNSKQAIIIGVNKELIKTKIKRGFNSFNKITNYIVIKILMYIGILASGFTLAFLMHIIYDGI